MSLGSHWNIITITIDIYDSLRLVCIKLTQITDITHIYIYIYIFYYVGLKQ